MKRSAGLHAAERSTSAENPNKSAASNTKRSGSAAMDTGVLRPGKELKE